MSFNKLLLYQLTFNLSLKLTDTQLYIVWDIIYIPDPVNNFKVQIMPKALFYQKMKIQRALASCKSEVV